MRLIIAALLLLGGCHAPEISEEDKLLATAEKAVADRLKDGPSARFTRVKITRPGVVCGHVNSKNSFGAYAGAVPFVYMTMNAPMSMVPVKLIGPHIGGDELDGQPSASGWVPTDLPKLRQDYC